MSERTIEVEQKFILSDKTEEIVVTLGGSLVTSLTFEDVPTLTKILSFSHDFLTIFVSVMSRCTLVISKRLITPLTINIFECFKC